MELLRRLNLIGVDLTDRDATLCYAWSRMRYVDEEHKASRAKMTHLAFEDFLEALCRVAGLLALPTDEEVTAAGSAHAGEYCKVMERDLPDDYTRFQRSRAVSRSTSFTDV